MKEFEICGIPCRHETEIASTNRALTEALRAGETLPMPFCLVADRQTRGRGRMTRTFVSPEGGLYMSLLLPVQNDWQKAQMTPPAAVAVCRALEELGVAGTQIKWVNDVYLGGRKICGILCEGVPGGVVIGIGVNLKTPPGGFPPEAGPAGAVDHPAVTRDLLLEKLLYHLPRAICLKNGEREAYRSRSLLTGKQVTAQAGEQVFLGTVRDIDEDFGLVLEDEKGACVTLRSGEVTRVRENKPTAFFDFDGTMRPGDSIVPYVAFVRKQGMMSFPQYIRVLLCTAAYLLHLAPSTLPKTAALRFRRGYDQHALDQLDDAFAEEMVRTCYRDALSRWQEHKAQGHRVVLLSASTENYMHFVAARLGADALLCTPVEPDGSVKRNCHGKAKVEFAEAFARENGVDWAASCAYGDSGSDIFILTRVGIGAAVNPKKKLAKLLKQHALPAYLWK